MIVATEEFDFSFTPDGNNRTKIEFSSRKFAEYQDGWMWVKINVFDGHDGYFNVEQESLDPVVAKLIHQRDMVRLPTQRTIKAAYQEYVRRLLED